MFGVGLETDQHTYVLWREGLKIGPAYHSPLDLVNPLFH